MSRPIFYNNNNKDQKITAAGIMFYRKYKEDIELLMISSKRGIEDFGGCTDNKDNSPIDTAVRETFEESNGLLGNDMNNRINYNMSVYNKNSKYLLFFCELLPSECHKPEKFGTFEKHENIKRSIIYVNRTQIKKKYKSELNFRLRNKDFYTKLFSL